MSEHFSKIMSGKSDEELLEIISNYSTDALSSVIKQVESRGLTSDSLNELKTYLDQEELNRAANKQRFKTPSNSIARV